MITVTIESNGLSNTSTCADKDETLLRVEYYLVEYPEKDLLITIKQTKK